MSDSKVVVVDASSFWIVETFFLFDNFGVFGVVFIGLFLACLALLLLGYFWRVWRYFDWAYFLLE